MPPSWVPRRGCGGGGARDRRAGEPEPGTGRRRDRRRYRPYLAGSYLYAHDAWFRNDLAKPVGHFFVDVGEGTAHVAAKVYGGVVHYGGDVLNALGL